MMTTTMVTGSAQMLGKDVQVVHGLPPEVLNKVAQAMEAFFSTKDWERWERLDNILDFIAGGYCGRVYDLGEYILKVNKRKDVGANGLRDGQIMHALQGLPCIPKVYMYAEDNSFMVVQKIKGKTVSDLQWDSEFNPESYDFEEQKARLAETQKGMDERGWVMADCHQENCMVDEEGNYWLVDVGLFHRVDEEAWGRSYRTALETLEKANHTIKTNRKRKEVAHLPKAQQLRAILNQDRTAQEVQVAREAVNKFRMSVVEFAQAINGNFQPCNLKPVSLMTFSTDYYESDYDETDLGTDFYF